MVVSWWSQIQRTESVSVPIGLWLNKDGGWCCCGTGEVSFEGMNYFADRNSQEFRVA